jgi:hypothetical protein
MLSMVLSRYCGDRCIQCFSSRFIRVLAMNIAFCRRAWNFYRIELPLNPELWLDLNLLSENECMSYFCFSRQHIHLLVSKLEFPDVIITYHCDRVMAVEAFCLKMKVRGTQVEAYWHVSAFLTNAILCAQGSNQISKYFNLPPPTLEQFLDETMNAYRNWINNN